MSRPIDRNLLRRLNGITQRMLEMFRAKPQPPKAKEPEKAA